MDINATMKVMVPVSALKKQNCESKKIFKKKVTFSDQIYCKNTQGNEELPPLCSSLYGLEYLILQVENNENLIKRLERESLRFYIKANFFLNVKIVKCKSYVFLIFNYYSFFSVMLC